MTLLFNPNENDDLKLLKKPWTFSGSSHVLTFFPNYRYEIREIDYVKKPEEMKILAELSHCTGSEECYRNTPAFLNTEGVEFLFRETQCHWLGDIIYSYQAHQAIKSNSMLQDIQFWKIYKNHKTNEAVVLCETDSLQSVLVQHIGFTDFTLSSYTLYLSNMNTMQGMLLLPSEY